MGLANAPLYLKADLHVIQCRSNVSHHGHEKERYLEDIILDEIQSTHNLLVPCCMLEVDYEAQEPE